MCTGAQSDRAAIAVDVRNICFPEHMWQRLCVVSVSLFLAIHFHRNDVWWVCRSFFFQSTNQSRPRTDSLGKSNKSQKLDQKINERRIVQTSDVHVTRLLAPGFRTTERMLGSLISRWSMTLRLALYVPSVYSYEQDIKYCKLYISLNKYIVVVVLVNLSFGRRGHISSCCKMNSTLATHTCKLNSGHNTLLWNREKTFIN